MLTHLRFISGSGRVLHDVHAAAHDRHSEGDQHGTGEQKTGDRVLLAGPRTVSTSNSG